MLLHDYSIECADNDEPDEGGAVRDGVGGQCNESKDQCRKTQRKREDVVPTRRKEPIPIGFVHALIGSCIAITVVTWVCPSPDTEYRTDTEGEHDEEATPTRPRTDRRSVADRSGSCECRGSESRSSAPSGVQVMVLNHNQGPLGIPTRGLHGCEEILRLGTIVIDGKTFGMALYADPDDEGEFPAYGEFWKIFTGTFKTKDGVLKRSGPGRVLMAGYDEGAIIGFGTFLFESFGTVEFAVGYFKWWDGHEVRQDGFIGPGASVAGLDNVFGLHGTFETD